MRILLQPGRVSLALHRTLRMTHTVTIANQQVPLTGSSPDILDKVMAFQPFQEWVQRFDKSQKERDNEMDVKSIEIQNTDIFGSGKLGFVKFKADVRFKDTGKNAPGIVFMVVECQGREKKKQNLDWFAITSMGKVTHKYSFYALFSIARRIRIHANHFAVQRG